MLQKHEGEFFETVRSQERELERLAPWLGGIFEMAGLMRFEISAPRKSGIRFAYPLMQLGDKWERVGLLQKMVGGNINPQPGGKTWHWRARSTAAVDLAESMRPCAPSRAAAVEAFLDWEDASVADRVEIAQDFNAEHARTADFGSVDPGAYAKLAKNGAFLAGIIDGAGRFSPGTDIDRTGGVDWVHHDLVVISKNQVLLEYLRGLYGGSIWTRYKPGEKVLAGGKRMNIRESSVRWTIGPRAKGWAELINLITGKLGRVVPFAGMGISGRGRKKEKIMFLG